MRPAFYDSPLYRKKQSTLTKTNRKKGIYNHLRKIVKRTCARKKCNKTFLVTPSDPKKYCSHSCATKVNNLRRSQGSPVPKEELISLYQNGLSANEIAEKLNISLNKIVYWLKKYQVKKRSLSEAIYLKYYPYGDPFKIKKRLTPEEKQLLGLGIGIYWGEGNKASRSSIAVSNSDPKLIKKFVEFLIRICQINTKKLKFSLQIFNDANPEASLKYWCSRLQIPKNKFYKPMVIPPQGKGTYKRKSKYGICCVVFGNVKLKKWIMSQLG